MTFYEFSKYLSELDETAGRLAIIDILTKLIHNLSTTETDKAIYLASGYLTAPFEDNKFNVADKMMIRMLEQAYGTIKNPHIKKDIETSYRNNGDLGSVAFELAQDKKPTEVTIDQIHTRLWEISQVEGSGSQDIKTKKVADLLNELDPLSAKYIVRIILGTTRLGFTEKTITDALSNFLGNRELKETIEKIYNIHPDIGVIAKQIKEHGMEGLDLIKIEPGVPVLSQKAQRISGVEEAVEKMGTVFAEFKFDGTRVQLHMDRNKEIKNTLGAQTLFSIVDKEEKSDFLVKTYTRNLEETTKMYPDLTEAAKKYIKADSVILDGEAIGFNKETGEFLPFQEIMHRKRKHDVAKFAKEVPLQYFVFDILYLNGKSVIHKTLRERKKILESVIEPNETIMMDEYREVTNAEDLYGYFEIAKEKSLEGIIAKKPEDSYQAGARSFSWIKIKKADEKLLADSVDCVVLGYYNGKGVRSKFGIGGFLVGVYDETSETFKTISKIGTGLTEEDWHELKQMCDKEKVANKVENVEMSKIFNPDVYVYPKIVVEIGADEITVSPSHTAGYALRFPRLLKFRQDKNAQQATTTKEIETMYNNQKHGNYNLKTSDDGEKE